MRSATVIRETNESAVSVSLDLDASDPVRIETGIRMFDHLLEQWAFHSGASLAIEARSIDGIAHHVVEDTAIALGGALERALGTRKGIARFGCVTLPMDEALVRCAVDLGGRAYSRIDLPLRRASIEDLASALIAHVFRSFAAGALVTLHIDCLAGEDDHHLAEAAFKAVARACRSAWAPDFAFANAISTKELV